jgi:hypothetical protein
MKSALGILAMLLMGTVLVAAAPQEPVKVAAEKQKSEEHGPKLTSLHIQVIFGEYEGEKKIASLPYAFDVVPLSAGFSQGSYGRRAELRSGVYIPFTSPKGEIEHQHVGTDIDCEAADLGEGRYALHLVLEKNWLMQEANKNPSAEQVRREVRAEAYPTLRDGQTVEAVVSTDPMNGHVYRVTVTMSVAK